MASKMPKIGDKKTFIPDALTAGLPGDYDRHVTGTVVYIHPQGRFYIVEVISNGHSWRETLYPEK